MLHFRTPEVFLHVLLISLHIQALTVHSHSHSHFQFHNHHTHIRNGRIPSQPWKNHESMAHEFLTAHNLVRAKYGMAPLIWDKKLAHFARRHASKLVASCDMVHSVGKYGENLFWGKLDHWTPARIVEDWAKEADYFDLKAGKCTKDWTECGHFTQIVWADTTHVGCYRLKCMGVNKGYIGICNYDPPGNVIEHSPFVRNQATTTANSTVKPSSPNQQH